jgi:hypothetical protein
VTRVATTEGPRRRRLEIALPLSTLSSTVPPARAAGDGGCNPAVGVSLGASLRKLDVAVVLLVAFVALGWSIIVYRSGSGWNPTGTDWNFENTGQLGDSFGVVSAFMTGLAAFFAFAAYRAATKQALEGTFLNLLERRYDVLSHVRVDESLYRTDHWESVQISGQHALDKVLKTLNRSNYHDRDKPLTDKIYAEKIKDVSGLPNLFRFMYHLVLFADEHFSQGRKRVIKPTESYKYAFRENASLTKTYDRLSEISHPNGLGTQYLYPAADAPENHQVVEHYRHSTGAAIWQAHHLITGLQRLEDFADRFVAAFPQHDDFSAGLLPDISESK